MSSEEDHNIERLLSVAVNVTDLSDLSYKLFLLINASMLMNGFSPENSIEWPENSSVCRVPYKSSMGNVRLNYIKKSSCSIIVHCFVSPSAGEFVKAFTVEFTGNYSLAQLGLSEKYREIFNRLITPVQIASSKVSKGGSIAQLSSLPADIKFILLSYLDASSLSNVMRTCTILYAIGQMNCFWKPLYARDFREAYEKHLSKGEQSDDNFYVLYCREASAHSVKNLIVRIPFPPFLFRRPHAIPSPHFPPPMLPRPRPFGDPSVPFAPPARPLLPKINFFNPGGFF